MASPLRCTTTAACLVALLSLALPASAQTAEGAAAFADAARDAQNPSPAGVEPPRALLVDKDDFRLALRGMAQFLAVPYAGRDALVDNGDVVDFAGMRVRRMQLGVEGRQGSNISFGVWLDLAESPLLLQARLAYTFIPQFSVEAGVVPIPFSKSAILSGGDMSFTERPHAVHRLVPDRQPGIAAYGAFLEGKVSYRAGVFNGAGVDRPGLGNDHPGVMGAGRVAWSPLGALRPGQADLQKGAPRIEIGANAYYDHGARWTGQAYGADVSAQLYGLSVLVEYLYDVRNPHSQPIISPGLPDVTRRSGLVSQLSYVLWQNGLEIAARAELVDDNHAIDDVGDFLATAVGLHWYISGLDLRVAADWYRRTELQGVALDNDTFVLATQGRF